VRRVDWTTRALNDLDEIIAYIQERNPFAAERMRALIEAAVERAVVHPYAYRSGRVPGTRELVAHPNYIIVFSVTDEALEIRTVVHARQQYP
jgi:toxin ParE1/3/4